MIWHRRAAALVPAGAAAVVAGAGTIGTGASISEVAAAAAIVVAAAAAVAWWLASLGRTAQATWVAAAALALSPCVAGDSHGGSDLARAALVISPLPTIALAGRSVTSGSKVGLWLALAGATLGGPVRVVFFSPFLDPRCELCLSTPLTVVPDAAAGQATLTIGALLVTAGLGAALRGSRRRIAAIAILVLAVSGLPVLGLNPQLLAETALLVASASGAATAVELLRARRVIADLSAAVDVERPVVIRLREAFKDPDLIVDFADGEAHRFVLADGRASDGPPAGSVTATIGAGSHSIRVHHAANGSADDLLRRPSAGFLIELEQVRLDALLAARVIELQASRARIVHRADEERRRLERDLHDGAQQHVLAFAFDLRSAIITAAPSDRAVLQSCVDRTLEALDELRDIAHGAYPPLLAAGGLATALAAFGRRAPVDLTSVDIPDRCGRSAQGLAYQFVVGIVMQATSPVRVVGTGSGADRLVLEATASGTAPERLMLERVAALGGTLDQHGGDVWRLELPCE